MKHSYIENCNPLKGYFSNLPYREIKIESWYQELFNKSEKTQEEEVIFSLMSDLRKSHHKNKKSKNIIPLIKHTYFDWDSKPILHWEYLFKFYHFPRYINKTLINGWEVRTIWLGYAFYFFAGIEPKIFETLIFTKDERIENYQELYMFEQTYSNIKDAEKGHQEACKIVRGIVNNGYDIPGCYLC